MALLIVDIKKNLPGDDSIKSRLYFWLALQLVNPQVPRVGLTPTLINHGAEQMQII